MTILSSLPLAIGVGFIVNLVPSGNIITRLLLGLVFFSFVLIVAVIYTIINYWLFFSKEPYKSWFNIRD